VIAALALESGRALSVKRLIDALWGDAPPATAREQVHIQVSKLRATLAGAGASTALRTEPDGYRLHAGRVDLAEVIRLQELARADLAVGQPDAAATKLRAALERWSGTPLDGVSPHLVAAHAPRLDELWLCLVEERIDAELACGHAAALVPELSALVRAHPLREGLHHRRMLALYRAGRRADALVAFREARQVLRDELGMDPPRELVELEAEILASGSPHEDEPASRLTPAQLPPRTRGFAGRTAELAELAAVLARPGPAGAPRLVLITGMPGVGKTTLAVHAGTAAVEMFPDGQLYVDLRGADSRPEHPLDVLGGFLRALGVRARSMPADLAGRTADFRSRTTGRRILVVLDNAAAADQVEPLLTAEPACATVVTSRFALPELESAIRVPVTPLPDTAARAVLENVAGAQRLADPGPVALIVKACAGLPLALRIVAGQLAAFPSLDVADMATRLSDEPRRMHALTAGHKSVRSSLDTSLRLLDHQARRALVALAMIGCPTFTSWPLAPLLDMTPARADELVEQLALMHLLEPAGPGRDGIARYRTHDLIRAHCRGVGPDLKQDAVDRLIGWAIALASSAYQGLTHRPTRYRVVADTAARLGQDILAWVIKEPLLWLGADIGTLLALVDLAIQRGEARTAATLLLVLRVPLVRLDLIDQGARIAARLETMVGQDAMARVSAALVAATARLHRSRYADVVQILTAMRPELDEVDPALRAEVLFKLGDAYERCRDVPQALTALREAAEYFDASGDTSGQAGCLISLSTLNRDHVGDLDAALRHARKALRLTNLVGDWKASAMAKVAVVHGSLAVGDIPTAQHEAAEALALVERDGDLVGQTWCLILLAQAHRVGGDLAGARELVSRALELARRSRRPDAETAAQVESARIELAAGNRVAAERCAKAALELTARFDSPTERHKVEQLLAELDRSNSIANG
jgi:DNA-binding SARP family transcriptional activator